MRPAFADWARALDAYFLLYGGFTRVQFPFHERTWRLLWAYDWTAPTVAGLIIDWLYEAVA